MLTLGDPLLILLALGLALIMTLIALASYHSYETTRKRLLQVEAELQSVKAGSQDFRTKTTEAFAEQKSLRVRIESLERSLALAGEELNKEREEAGRLRVDYIQLTSEYEATKLNLTEAYKRMRATS
jgi:predicted nuclease with TOPRIM domain